MKIPFMPATGCCSKCGLPVEGLDRDFVCEECAKTRKFRFDTAISAARMEGVFRRALISYKFDGHIWMADDFADWMMAALSARTDPDAIDLVLSIPATIWHRIDRGYDQCAILARRIAKRIDRKFMTGVVKRRGNPKRQSLLSGGEREENVRGSFAVAKPEFVRGRTILLVDDVMTSGATLSECAGELKEAGAWRVVCLTLGRAMP